MSEIKAMSLCSGYGGLDLAIEKVMNVKTVAFSEIDTKVEECFQTHWPKSKSLGDLSLIRWADWANQIELVSAGFPCQDLSYAGKGLGIQKGTRSGLWYDIANGISEIRPTYVVLENVAAIVNRRPGLDVVLAGLTQLGFDAKWICLQAAQVGAAHRRNRFFLFAWAKRTDPDSIRRSLVRQELPQEGNKRQSQLELVRVGSATADTNCEGLQRKLKNRCEKKTVGDIGRSDRTADVYGKYTDAIRRWETVTGRKSPNAVDGKQKLNPKFVEWLMGLDDGWVTDNKKMTRKDKIKALGNGVVPQQAETALRVLLGGFYERN